MDNIEKWGELRKKLEKLCQERLRIETSILRQEEKLNIRELKETDFRYKNMVWLYDRYITLGLEIDETRKELENLRGTSHSPKRETELSSSEEGLELGLNKFDIENLPNMDTDTIALILEKHPGSLTFVKKILEQNGKTLNIKELVEYLVDEIDEPYFDPDEGYEDVEGKKNVLKELGYDYEELKEAERAAEREENAFYINEYGEIIRPADENFENVPSTEAKAKHHQSTIDPELKQWLNGVNSKTPLQKRETELSSLEDESKKIDAEFDKQKGQDIGE